MTKNNGLATDLVAYMLLGADAFGARRTEELLRQYVEAKREYGLDRRKLPNPVI